MFLVLVLVAAGTGWFFLTSNGPVPVVRDTICPERDAVEIAAVVKQKLRRDIIKGASWKDLRAIPAALRRYSSIKLIQINTLQRDEGADVLVWLNTNSLPDFPGWTNKSIYSMPGYEWPLSFHPSDFVTLVALRQSNEWKVFGPWN